MNIISRVFSHHFRSVFKATLVLTLWISIPLAQAQAYKCQNQAGRIEYSSRPCSAAEGQKALGEVNTLANPKPVLTQDIKRNDTNTNNDDQTLIDRCVSVQLKVRKLQEEISQRKVRQSSGAKDFGSTSVQEDGFAIQRLQIEIGERERQGRLAGCERVGAGINSGATRAKALNIVCSNVRSEIAVFTTGNGRTDPRATEFVSDLKKELRTNGC
jgi:hypothetical protein